MNNIIDQVTTINNKTQKEKKKKLQIQYNTATKHTLGTVPKLSNNTSPMSQNQSGGRVGTTPNEFVNFGNFANAAPTPAPRNSSINGLGNNLMFDLVD